jgi:hypothetical protein
MMKEGAPEEQTILMEALLLRPTVFVVDGGSYSVMFHHYTMMKKDSSRSTVSLEYVVIIRVAGSAGQQVPRKSCQNQIKIET